MKTVATLAALGGLLLAACGAPPPPPPPPTISSRCPDISKADEVGAFDFAGAYNLSPDAAGKLKAAALAAFEVSELGDRLDAELGISCSQIARDLGATGDWRSGNDACGAAIKAVQEAREKLGAKAAVQLVVRAPVCLADPSLMTKCASICDSSVPAERAKAECVRKVGRCDGDCEGPCEPRAQTRCEGECAGTCEGQMKGACGGICRGRCEGSSSGGGCVGICTGVCEKGMMTGSCSGRCSGTCTPEKPSMCQGTCAGTCSVELTDAKCAGGFGAPGVSSDCRARCSLLAMSKTECSVPQVGFVSTGASDRKTASALKAAIDKSAPGLFKILFEVGEHGPKRVLDAQATIAGARAGIPEIARSGGKETFAASSGQLRKCFEEPFKKAETAASSVKTALDQAIAIREEISK